MKRFFAKLSRRFTGGEAALAAQPILAGYRREMAPGWRLVILGVVALGALAYGLAFSYMAPARMMPLVAPIALLCGLVIWILPAGDYAPTRVLEPLFMAFFVALILWPNYLAISLPGLPWLTLLRITGTPLLATLLICISVSSYFRTRLWEVLRTDRAVWWLLIGIVVMQTVTLPLSPDLGSSINRWIIAQMNWTSIFIISCIVFMRPGFATFWVRFFLAMMFLLGLLGIWESRVSTVLWAAHIPDFLKIDDPTVLKILDGSARATTGIYRVQGPSSTALGFAELLGLSIPFALHILVENRKLIMKAAATIYIPVIIYVILLTDSRLGLVATLFSFLFYFLSWAISRARRNTGDIIAPAILLAYPIFFVAAVAASFLVQRIRVEIWGGGAQASSDDARIDQWIMGIPKVMSNPIGYGPGQSAEILGFANRGGTVTIDTYYLSVLLEIGVIGFICYFGLFLRSAWMGVEAVFRERPDGELRLLMPLAVSVVNFVIVKAVLSQDSNHPLAFIMVGAIIALTYRARKAQPNS